MSNDPLRDLLDRLELEVFEPLKKRRDQMLSHNAFQRTLSDREWNIEWADLEAAYSRALKLVNRVYEAYKGHDAMPVTGAKEATVSKELSTIFSFARRSDSDPAGRRSENERATLPGTPP